MTIQVWIRLKYPHSVAMVFVDIQKQLTFLLCDWIVTVVTRHVIGLDFRMRISYECFTKFVKMLVNTSLRTSYGLPRFRLRSCCECVDYVQLCESGPWHKLVGHLYIRVHEVLCLQCGI